MAAACSSDSAGLERRLCLGASGNFRLILKVPDSEVVRVRT
jgi:hypothetical protein